MNMYEVSRLVRREWIWALVCAVVAFALAILATYQLSLSPLSAQPRRFQMGIASQSALVDRHRSLLGNDDVSPARVGAIAADYAQLLDSPPVIDHIARAIGSTPAQIGVQVQLTQRVSVSQSSPLEPQVGEEILATRKRYYLTVRNTTGSQVIALYSQGPNRQVAGLMVTSALTALQDLAHSYIRSANVAADERVVIKRLGQVSASTLDGGVSKDAAILVGIAAWLFLFVGVVTFKASARRSRARRPAPRPPEPGLA